MQLFIGSHGIKERNNRMDNVKIIKVNDNEWKAALTEHSDIFGIGESSDAALNNLKEKMEDILLALQLMES